jgi:hypothetical protein
MWSIENTRSTEIQILVLLSMKQIADAEDLVDEMERATPPTYERRQTLYALDRAKCYMALGGMSRLS